MDVGPISMGQYQKFMYYVLYYCARIDFVEGQGSSCTENKVYRLSTGAGDPVMHLGQDKIR